MFDPDEITQEVTSQIGRYLKHLFQAFFPHEANLPLNLSTENLEHLFRPSPFAEEIRLLVRIANGEIPPDLADDILIEEVEEAIQSVSKKLFTAPGQPHHSPIPAPFWDTELGRVVLHCQLWLRGDDLITYTEAASIVWPDDVIQVARMRVKRLVERGEWTAYSDPLENNPQHAARVSRQEVEQYHDDHKGKS